MKKNLKILLVEDNEGDIRLIEELLSEQAVFSYELFYINSLKEFELFNRNGLFYTVLLDLGLPDSTGLDTFTRVKSICSEDCSIIILTGLNDNETGLSAVNKGAQDYLVKGNYDSETLVKSIVYSFERTKLQSELRKQLSAKEKAERETVKINERLDLIAYRTSAVMYKANKDGTEFEYLHEAMTSLTGYTPGEISDIGFSSIIKNAEIVGAGSIELERLHEYWAEKSNKNVDLEYLIQTKEGDLKWVSDKSYPIGNGTRTSPGSIGILMDICSAKEAEIEILSQKKRSDQLFSNSPIAIALLDKEGTVLNANNSFKMTFGYSPDEIIGENIDDLIVPQELRNESTSLNDKLVRGKSVSELSYRKKKNDSLIYVALSGVPIRVKGQVTGYYGMFIDLTKQKLAEEALIKARDEAEESNRLKTAFLHNISHEIRTPMNAIVGFSALLGEPGQSEETRQSFIDTIVNSSNHLLSIINDIVEVSNIEADLLKISKSEVDINHLFIEIENSHLNSAEEKNLELKFVPDKGSDQFIASIDNTKVYQIISNLVGNAIKFTSSGKVEFGYMNEGAYLEIFVSDTGIGIPDSHLDTIFDRFYQVDNSETRQFEGTGLGLSISKSYVELLGGRIWVNSSPGKGSTFYFTLPLEENNSAADKISLHKDSSNTRKSGNKILVAEDVESNFRLIEFYLSSLDCELLWSVNGKEAVDTFEKNSDITIILMDLKMPVMDGYMAVREIRKKDSTIPIIAQTAYVDDLEKALESGCNGFISKPFKRSELLDVVRKYISDS